MAKISSSIKTEPYKVEIKSSTGNSILADEPISKGGAEQRTRLLRVAEASPIHKILTGTIEIETELK